MAVAIAMLRGVNVGGHRKLSMEALRSVFADLGMRSVQTYIQSGNVVFEDDAKDPLSLARRLEDGIQDTFGFKSDVIVRTTAELRKVIATNPFAAAKFEPSRLLAVFMASAPARQVRDQILALPCEPEEMHVKGRELYIYYPDGMARPKIPLARFEKLLQCPTTGRNWNTVNKLLAMAETLEAQH
jgi:uncharacterized protein (DUF1697 family)